MGHHKSVMRQLIFEIFYLMFPTNTYVKENIWKNHTFGKIRNFSEESPLEAENWSFYYIFGYSDSGNKYLKLCELQGSAKGKYEIVKLLLKHGADPTKKNRDGHTPMDLVKEGM